MAFSSMRDTGGRRGAWWYIIIMGEDDDDPYCIYDAYIIVMRAAAAAIYRWVLVPGLSWGGGGGKKPFGIMGWKGGRVGGVNLVRGPRVVMRITAATNHTKSEIRHFWIVFLLFFFFVVQCNPLNRSWWRYYYDMV